MMKKDWYVIAYCERENAYGEMIPAEWFILNAPYATREEAEESQARTVENTKGTDAEWPEANASAKIVNRDELAQYGLKPLNEEKPMVDADSLVSLEEIREDFAENDWYLSARLSLNAELEIDHTGESRDKLRCLLSFHMPGADEIENGITALTGWLEDESGNQEFTKEYLSSILNILDLEIGTRNAPLDLHLAMFHPDAGEGEIWDYLDISVTLPGNAYEIETDKPTLQATLTPEYIRIAGKETETDVTHARLEDVIKALRLQTDLKIWACTDC